MNADRTFLQQYLSDYRLTKVYMPVESVTIVRLFAFAAIRRSIAEVICASSHGLVGLVPDGSPAVLLDAGRRCTGSHAQRVVRAFRESITGR